MYTGRFAPSPTGPLHLGSLATAVASYLDARAHHGKWLIRIDDLDPQRCRSTWSQEILSTLANHGLHPDKPPVFQSEQGEAYLKALNGLTDLDLTYPCCCTRHEIEQANLNRPAGMGRIYPGTCANGMPVGREARAIRFRCPSKPIEWKDHHLGSLSEDLTTTSGDFVIKRADGFWAYHLAVVVDDLASQVTHVVRGDDLADTTARQIALVHALGEQPPSYWHLPVILAAGGQKLSKQTGATALENNHPIENLNRVWKHFDQTPHKAATCEQWLAHALLQWPAYRNTSQCKPPS